MRNKIYSAYGKLERNPDPIYGDGYRLIKRYAAKNGTAALMRDILRFRDSSLQPIGAPKVRGIFASGGLVASEPVGFGRESGTAADPTPAAVGPRVFQDVVYVDPAPR